jgi:hypothetical protein
MVSYSSISLLNAIWADTDHPFFFSRIEILLQYLAGYCYCYLTLGVVAAKFKCLIPIIYFHISDLRSWLESLLPSSFPKAWCQLTSI